MPNPDLDTYRVRPGSKVDLSRYRTDEDGGLTKDQLKARFDALIERLDGLQEKLYAQGRHALLVVLQAMDTGGKDSTIRQVFGPLDALGMHVWSFKSPTSTELAHDFLWRVHERAPERGHIAVFNRSHYEDVLIARVKRLAPEARWGARYGHINAFERMLHDEGTRVVKFFLHVSKDYQKERLQKRLDDPEKRWKFNPADLTERERWDEYQHAYADALGRCSTEEAPWYVIPAENRPFRNVLIAQALVDLLESLKPDWPEPNFDPGSIVIK